MNSVGHAYAVLKGRRNGDQNQAKEFLGSMFKEKLRARNNQESRGRHKKAYRPGQKVK